MVCEEVDDGEGGNNLNELVLGIDDRNSSAALSHSIDGVLDGRRFGEGLERSVSIFTLKQLLDGDFAPSLLDEFGDVCDVLGVVVDIQKSGNQVVDLDQGDETVLRRIQDWNGIDVFRGH